MERESVYYNAVAIEQLFVLYVEGGCCCFKAEQKKKRERDCGREAGSDIVVVVLRVQVSLYWRSEAKLLFFLA